METRKIGNFEIGEKELNQFISRLPQDQQAAAASNESFRKQIESRLEEIALFAALGEEMNLEEREEYKQAMAASRRDYISQMAMSEVLRDITVEDGELEAYFEEHKAEFAVPPTASAKHILVGDEAEAESIKAQIEAGEIEFSDAAYKHSTCPSKQQGGDLGYFEKGQMVPEFDEAVFNGEVGKIVGPIKTQFGYHIIKVEALNEGEAKPFEEIKDQVQQFVIYDKQSKAFDEKLEELKAKYL